MSIPVSADFSTSVDEYLAREVLSETKHDFLGGAVYARAEASEAHNIIAMNLCCALVTRLRGKPCHAFGSDMRVRLNPLGETCFYYPDAMISCDPTEAGRNWRERPTALFEIISEETRRIDEREKRLTYLQLPSLEACVRLEQARPEVVVELRSELGWMVQSVSGLQAVVLIPALGLELPFAELYDRLEFLMG
jgi:Uma2 family endonuclease